MRILLTNDDGITSCGINLLSSSLRNAGHRVYVVAPDTNRSGCSHSICFLHEPIKVKEIEKDSWSCSGTPVDCVITALLGGIPEIDIKKEPPDLILSGINKGANLGTDIIYSGTAAAARQGSLFGIPSVALSLVENNKEWHWENAISFFTENIEKIKSFWKKETFVNVNFPNNNERAADIVITFPSKRCYNDRMVIFPAPGGSLYCFADLGNTETMEEPGCDWDEVRRNNVSLSVIMSQPVCSAQGGSCG